MSDKAKAWMLVRNRAEEHTGRERSKEGTSLAAFRLGKGCLSE